MEVNVLNEERDMITIISSISMMNGKLDILEQKLDNITNKSLKTERKCDNEQLERIPKSKQSIDNNLNKYITPQRPSFNTIDHQDRPNYKMNQEHKFEDDSLNQMLNEIENITPIKEEAKYINNIIEQEIEYANVNMEHKNSKSYFATGQPSW